jgi:exosortase B
MTDPRAERLKQHLPAVGLISIAYAAAYFHTYQYVSEHIWSQVGQGHGPIIVMLVLWLAYLRIDRLPEPSQENQTFYFFVILFGGIVNLVGNLLEIILFSSGSQIFVLAGVLGYLGGHKWVKVMALPLFFIVFSIPLPGPIVDLLTGPLKTFVSYISESALAAAGYPVGRSGVTITIGQYQLLVADACAGLNSLFALEAIGVFYMSIASHKSVARNIILGILILPISVFSNVTRVITLILVTHYFGDEVGQGFIHNFAGILLIAISTLVTIGTDNFLGLFFKEPETDVKSNA